MDAWFSEANVKVREISVAAEQQKQKRASFITG